MTEDELQKKRQEFRDSEVQNKIAQFSTAEDFRQHTLKANYTRKVVKVKFGKLGWSIVLTQATGLLFFSSLFLLSYLPKTKFLVSKIMP